MVPLPSLSAVLDKDQLGNAVGSSLGAGHGKAKGTFALLLLLALVKILLKFW